MKVKYFPDTDTAHVEFKDNDIDIDAKGNLVGMIIEHAKANTDLWEFSFQEMPQQTA